MMKPAREQQGHASADADMAARVLDLIPQQPPFRFVDDILSMDEDAITGAYTFKEDEYFYQGHFPNMPVTPGVILIEAMAQTGAVAHAIYHMLLQGMDDREIGRRPFLFTLADGVAFHKVVRPGDRVVTTGKKQFFRRGGFRTQVHACFPNGDLVCEGILTGTGATS